MQGNRKNQPQHPVASGFKQPWRLRWFYNMSAHAKGENEEKEKKQDWLACCFEISRYSRGTMLHSWTEGSVSLRVLHGIHPGLTNGLRVGF